MTTDFRRLGKRGSYRLGQLRAQGVGEIRRPVPFRPNWVRPDHRWPTPVWLLGLLFGVLLIAAGAAVDWWFMPLVAGVLAGAANWIGRWSLRAAVPAVAVMAALGWLAPWWWAVLHGQPYGADARIAAVLLGLPGYAAVGLVVTIAVPVAQVVFGYWLGRALTPLPVQD